MKNYYKDHRINVNVRQVWVRRHELKESKVEESVRKEIDKIEDIGKNE